MLELSTGLFWVWVVALIIAALIYLVGYILPIRKTIIISLSRTLFAFILPSVVLLGYLAFNSMVLKNEIKSQVELIPYSKLRNLKPLWLFSKNKQWTFHANRGVGWSLDFYKNRKVMGDFVFVSSCGSYCLEYRHKVNNSTLKIHFKEIGNSTFIDYFIQEQQGNKNKRI